MKMLQIVAPVLGALLLTGCAGTDNSMNDATETVCVVSGEPADGGPTAEYMGQTVHFCCDNCKGKWDRMSDEGKKKALAGN